MTTLTLIAASAVLSKMHTYMESEGPMALVEKHGDEVFDACLAITEGGGVLSPENKLMLDIVTATKSAPEADDESENVPASESPDDTPRKAKPAKAKATDRRAVFVFGYSIPGKTGSLKTKFYFSKGKAQAKADKLAERGYKVTPVKSGPRDEVLVPVAA